MENGLAYHFVIGNGKGAGEFRRVMDSDRVLQRTLTLLRESGTTSELLQLAALRENSDWTPVVAAEEAQEEGSPTR